MSTAAVAALLTADGIGEPFFCHLRLDGSDAAAEEQAAALLALAERPLGRVAGLVVRHRNGAGGVAHWLVQARHAGGVTQLQLRLGGVSPAAEAVLEGRDGTLSLDRDGTVLRHGRAGAEVTVASNAAPAEAAACRRLLALLHAAMAERPVA